MLRLLIIFSKLLIRYTLKVTFDYNLYYHFDRYYRFLLCGIVRWVLRCDVMYAMCEDKHCLGWRGTPFPPPHALPRLLLLYFTYTAVQHSTILLSAIYLLHKSVVHCNKNYLTASITNWLVDCFRARTHCSRFGIMESKFIASSVSTIQGSAAGPSSYVATGLDLRPLTSGNLMVQFLLMTHIWL